MKIKQLGWIAPTPELLILHCNGRRKEDLKLDHVLTICQKELPGTFGWWQKLRLNLHTIKAGDELTLLAHDPRFFTAAAEAKERLLYSTHTGRGSVFTALTLSDTVAAIYETVYLYGPIRSTVKVLSEDIHVLVHVSAPAA